jgi:hypothetical protein
MLSVGGCTEMSWLGAYWRHFQGEKNTTGVPERYIQDKSYHRLSYPWCLLKTLSGLGEGYEGKSYYRLDMSYLCAWWRHRAERGTYRVFYGRSVFRRRLFQTCMFAIRHEWQKVVFFRCLPARGPVHDHLTQTSYLPSFLSFLSAPAQPLKTLARRTIYYQRHQVTCNKWIMRLFSPFITFISVFSPRSIISSACCCLVDSIQANSSSISSIIYSHKEALREEY